MKQPSFLARKMPWWPHWPNYFLLAMAVAFLVAFVPRGVRQAVESNTNKAEDWLPSNYAESIDLRWFRDHFMGEQFALVSWDGCTLGDTEKLDFLVRKLVPTAEMLESAPEDSDLHLRAKWYAHIISGPAVLDELMAKPLSLDYGDAIKRIEGALIGPPQLDAEGNSLGNESRATCLIVYLTEEATFDNKTMRRAIEKISAIASTECGIAEETIHMGGPPVDNITIDVEGEKTLIRLASLSGIIGFTLSYWCFRSIKLTAIVFAVGVLSAGMSLAIVFYFGVLEVMWTSLPRARLGTVDAILMSMPAVVYVLGLSGAIHIVNYYRDARRDQGLEGAAEAAVKLGWGPCALAALTTAVGLGSLYTSDILPIKKFGMFTAIGVIATVGVLFTVLPIFLHRFPVSDDLIRRQSGGRSDDHLPGWAKRIFGFVVGRPVLTCAMWAVVMGVFAFGMTRIETSVSLLKLLDPNTDLIHDYTWLEKNLANLVPMEVVLTIPPERCRTADEHAEADGKQYRLSTLERLNMLRMVQQRIEKLDEISRVMSVATYTPKSTNSGNINANRSGDYAKNKSLEENRDSLQQSGYLRIEQEGTSDRELWRVSARVAALGEDGEGVDYGQFVEQLKIAVDPVLVAYEQRDMVVRQLHAAGKKFDGAKICILYRTPGGADPEPPETAQESVLRNVLRDSGVAPRMTADGKMIKGPATFDLAKLDAQKDNPKFPEIMANAIKVLGKQDAIVLVSASSDPTAKQLADGGLHLIDVSIVPVHKGSAAIPLAIDEDQPRPIRAVYTGMIPLVYKTQRELLFSLKESIMWATVLIAVVMMFVLRSPIAGIISMVPNVFPIVIIFGILGWLSIKVDIGIMMTASVALGVAVDDTVHFLTWFRRGVTRGMNRVEAVMLAYDRCATAMLQTTIIGGLGLAVFATSTFTPTQQFGYLMISMLGAALIGDLLLLPAILVSPLGHFFGGKAPALASEMPTGETQLLEPQLLETKSLETPSVDTPPTEDVLPIQPAASSDIQPKQPEPLSAKSEIAAEDEIAADDQVTISTEQLQKELQDGPHSALHAKLRNLRRDSSRDSLSK